MKQKMSLTKFRHNLNRSVHLATLGKDTQDMQRVLLELTKKASWLSQRLARKLK